MEYKITTLLIGFMIFDNAECTGKSSKWIQDVSLQNKMATTHEIQTVIVASTMQCISVCATDNSCVSIFFVQNACRLNNAYFYDFSLGLVASDGSAYHAKVSECYPINPCLYSGLCRLDNLNPSGFICDCTAGRTGNICQTISGGDD